MNVSRPWDFSMSAAHTLRWQRITLWTLFTGYSGYYLCRSNLSVVATLLTTEYAAQGMDERAIGGIASLGVLFYAIGKVTNGLLTDIFDGRLMFLMGMLISVVCTVVFGLVGGLFAFSVLWALNRYAQSMGWGGLIKIAAHWFPVGRQASVMGVLSMSYLLGDAAARVYLGSFIRFGVDWRGVFFISAGTLSAIAVVCWFTLKANPREVGAEEPTANPKSAFAEPQDKSPPENLLRLLLPLLTHPTFVVVCLMNVGLTLLRETFTFWTPTYLVKVVGLDKGWAAQVSMLFPLIGALSALLGGWLSDRCQGKHGRVALPALVTLTAALWLLSVTPTQGEPTLALLLIGGIAFCLMAPYSFCSGVMALDLGGKRGSSTAAGVIDCAGYLGATLSGIGIGSLAQDWGWSMAFTALTGVAVLTTLATVLYCLLQEPYFGRRRSLPQVPESATMMEKPVPRPNGQEVIQRIFQLFAERGAAAYLGEPVSQQEHALQTAWAAEQAHAASPLIAAALLHDIGHLLHHLPEDCAQTGTDDRHEELGARWVEKHFGATVSEPIRLHVPAKRYLCAAEPGYRERLTPASQLSLQLQGGPFAAEEAAQFARGPHFAAAIALRRWDEEAKIAGLPTPPLEHFRPHLEAALDHQRH